MHIEVLNQHCDGWNSLSNNVIMEFLTFMLFIILTLAKSGQHQILLWSALLDLVCHYFSDSQSEKHSCVFVIVEVQLLLHSKTQQGTETTFCQKFVTVAAVV